MPSQAFPGLGSPPPVFAWLGGEVLAAGADGTSVVLRFPVRAEMMNPNAVLQGGVAVAMADCAVGICATLADPARTSTTIELSTRFLRPFTKGHATARGTILKRGRTAVVVEVEMLDDTGALCVKTTATNVYLDAKP